MTQERGGSSERRPAIALVQLGARAAGLWSIRGETLVQEGFEAAADMPVEVARRFAEATLVVPMDRRELGIVQAVVERRVVVSVAAELDPAVGSGYWLRAFAADRSVAVPRFDGSGAVLGVFSVAITGKAPDSATVQSILETIDQG